MMPPETNQADRFGDQRLEEPKPLFGRLAGLILAVAAMAMAGCATHDSSPPSPKPGEGVAQYRQLVQESLKAITTMVASLDRVGAQTNRCSARLVKAFSEEVQQLQAESIKVRSRSQAIQARGEAYFQDWEKNLASVKDPKRRELAERHHPELQQCFARIKLGSQKAGEAFRPFLAGLRRLQNALESDAGSIGMDSTRELIRATGEHGAQVEQALATIRKELEAMTAMLTPANPRATH
jgi:hypothetical protein